MRELIPITTAPVGFVKLAITSERCNISPFPIGYKQVLLDDPEPWEICVSLVHSNWIPKKALLDDPRAKNPIENEMATCNI